MTIKNKVEKAAKELAEGYDFEIIVGYNNSNTQYGGMYQCQYISDDGNYHIGLSNKFLELNNDYETIKGMINNCVFTGPERVELDLELPKYNWMHVCPICKRGSGQYSKSKSKKWKYCGDCHESNPDDHWTNYLVVENIPFEVYEQTDNFYQLPQAKKIADEFKATFPDKESKFVDAVSALQPIEA